MHGCGWLPWWAVRAGLGGPLSAPNTVTAYIDHVPDQDEDAADRLQPRIAAAVVDVFVYVVVLNLFVEYLPQVISETFTLSLLTAVLLKAFWRSSWPLRTGSRRGSAKPPRR